MPCSRAMRSRPSRCWTSHSVATTEPRSSGGGLSRVCREAHARGGGGRIQSLPDEAEQSQVFAKGLTPPTRGGNPPLWPGGFPLDRWRFGLIIGIVRGALERSFRSPKTDRKKRYLMDVRTAVPPDRSNRLPTPIQ